MERAATEDTYQVTAENWGLAARRDCNTLLANLSSAEPGTQGVRVRELKRPSVLFPEQVGVSEDPSSNFTLFLTL